MSFNELINNKIVSYSKIYQTLSKFKEQNKKIVFTNGCFDLLHLGHVDYLSKAKDQGDILVIGLNSDFSVKNIKGDSRPIQDQISRAKILASLIFVDYVVLFDAPTPYELIRTIKPDVLIKGADYKIEQIVGHDIVKSYGGKVMTIPFIEGYSTTQIIKKIKSLD